MSHERDQFMSDERVPVSGEFYKHFKDKLYQIREIAYHSENQEKMVVYQAMYGDFRVYVRPYEMFMSEVDHVKYPQVKQKYRFEKVDIDSADVKSNMEVKSNIETESNIEVKSNIEAKSNMEIKAPLSDDENQECFADPRLLQFLDADTFQEKLNILTWLRSKMDDRLINDIATSLDITVEEGPIDKRYDSLRNCLLAHVKYECNRLR